MRLTPDDIRNGYGLAENLLTMATGGIAEPVSGLAALVAAAQGYDAGGARDAIRGAMTFQPKSAQGVLQQRALARLAQGVVDSAPVRTWQRGVDIAGRYSPAAGAALQTIPTAIGAAYGAKPAMQQGRAASMLAERMQEGLVKNALAPRKFHPQAGVFAGISALGADLKALGKAKQMTIDGISPDQIWKETGWTIGADGRWRFEIDDSASYMRGKKSFLGAPVRSDLSMGDLAGSGIDMQDILQHQALFDAYPELKNTQVSAGRFSDRGGDYSPGDGSIRIADNLSGDSARSVMLHEIQHAIQEKEGFQGGGSANDFMGVNANDLLMKKAAAEARINEINSRLRSAKGDEYMALLDERRALIPDAQIDDLDILENAHSKYMRLMGETEARNVQARMNMGREDRMRTPPIKTEDRARNLQIRINDAMRPRALHPQRGAVIVDGDLKRIAEFRKKDDVYQFENSEEFYRALNDFVEKNSANDAFEGMIMPTGHGQHNGYLMITPSAKKEGAWQVTHTDKNYMPISDEGIQTKADALESFARYSNPELWHE